MIDKYGYINVYYTMISILTLKNAPYCIIIAPYATKSQQRVGKKAQK